MRLLNTQEMQQAVGGGVPLPNGTYIGQTAWFEGTTYYWETVRVTDSSGVERWLTGWYVPVYNEYHQLVNWQAA
ncbi:hypothetical protein SAMN02745857_03659 [Andreprevotia lacus DSM 23236]|uniref:Uncharacterized protein n=1 Tax=Andreprevotia lacus DSM 23236 TaxID=1121001 RepID=A0A1W1Y067_9NEIS|nr:hypothetical protein SAMN02745857_03659 [Andreprevotia lacus DSM 23236]